MEITGEFKFPKYQREKINEQNVIKLLKKLKNKI